MSQMKNFMLAKAANTVPYYPRLNEITGSVTASILMMQLEYWFSKMNGNEFYKFLEPCENKSYSSGDSWTEELGFSKKEFRSAFGMIGKMYNSKKEYMASDDKFEDMYYLSYRDRIKGITVYVRNHEKVDNTLLEWSSVNKKEESTEVTKGDLRIEPNGTSVSDQSCSTEVTKGDLRIEPNGTSVSDQRAFPLSVDYNSRLLSGDYNQEITQDTTAEEVHICSEEHTSTPNPKVPYDDIVENFNSVCQSLSKVQQVSDKRKRAMRKMWKYANQQIEILLSLFQKTEDSDFLSGRAKSWKANFDWIMREDAAIKILEGQYDNNSGGSGGGVSKQLKSKGMQEFINGEW
ncbi:MAG: hypothetical protein AB9856_03710 [Cellulosilyticaceae bacterium]